MKKRRRYEELNYWDSMADGMVSLLLCILLVLLLLILYLVNMPDEDYVDDEWGDRYSQYDEPYDPGSGYDNYEQTDREQGEEGQGGETGDGGQTGQGGETGSGGQTGQGGETGEGGYPHQYDDPDPGAGRGDGGNKSAVFVQVVDQETDRTIKHKGLAFELYGQNASLQILSTYYPKKIDYKLYHTEEDGTFFLPEKVALEDYSLHSLSELEGYEITDYTYFTVDDSYDWDDPLVVTVEVYPEKNVIRVKLTDAENGHPLPEGTFDVVAAEDVITKDGTIRYRKGEIVDTVSLDEDGVGASRELYLGKYLLRQKAVQEYYARVTKDIPVTIFAKTNALSNQLHEVDAEKTRIDVTVQDALYDTVTLANAQFRLTEDGKPGSTVYETDSAGRVVIEDLEKNHTYRIRQFATAENYRMDQREYAFTVNGDGLIDGEQSARVEVKNRIVRVSVGVQDRLFRGQVSDINVALRNAEGQTVQVWSTTGLARTLEGLEPGSYTVLLDGNEGRTLPIEVEDLTEIQQFHFAVWTVLDTLAVIGGVLVLAGLVTGIVVFRKRVRESKKIGA